MKIIHIADVHANKNRKDVTIQMLNRLYKECDERNIDYVLISGDFWDCTVTNTTASGFTDILDAMAKLTSVTEVIMIYGTPEHEPDGSLEIFRRVGCYIIDSFKLSNFFEPALIIIALPEPRSSHYPDLAPLAKVKKIREEMLEVLKNNRKEKHGVPTVVMYHGEVRGSRYQNGMEAQSNIALTKDELRMCNADYYALGHIHQPQEVFVNCWYPGTPAPKNYGENHDGCFNVVTIEGGKTSVERVSFEFPRYLTLDVEEDMAPLLMKKDYTNTHVKVRFTCHDTSLYKNYALKLHKATNALSVRAQISEERTTNVRCKEIVEQKTTKDKFKSYAEVNHINYQHTLLDKLKALEESMLTSFTFPKHSFELVYAKIRGAKGLKREELEIDFENFNDGVIGLCAAIGSGKTLTIENCQPYPCLLTRDGKLTDHYYLRDSLRELIYRDEEGTYYKIIMNINGAIKTGSVEYLVYTSKDRETWIPVSECNGNLKCYETWVEETFGSKELFLSTCFTAKEATVGCKDISEATPTENMDLFAKLLGLSYYKTLEEMAKNIKKDLDSNLKAQSVLIKDKGLYESRIQGFTEALEEYESKLEEQKTAYEEAEKEVESLQQEYGKYLAHQNEMRSLNTIIKSLEDAIALKKETVADVEEDKRKADEVELHKRDISLYHSFSKKLEEQMAEIKAKEDEEDKLEKVREVEREKLAKLNFNILNIKNKISNLETDLEHYKQEDGHEDNCPFCGAVLSDEKKAEIKEKIKTLTSDIKKEEESLVPLNEDYTAVSNKIDEYDNEILSIIDNINALNEVKDLTLESVNQYKQYAELEGFTPKYKDHDAILKKMKQEIIQLETDISNKTNGVEVVKDVGEDLAIAKRKCEDLMKDYSQTIASINSANENLSYAKEELKKIREYEKGINNLRLDIDEYEILIKALSTTGIQALELEANIPQIKDYANSILHESFGDRFDIDFKTDDPEAKRAVFQIIVHNNETDETYPLKWVSSGERIWLKQAIYNAFSIVRINSTGFSFKTRFMDETDGSLDSEERSKYLKMINTVNSLGNTNKTILITHSQEIKDALEQMIEL